MKQIILTAAAVCCMVTSYAQKGSVLLFGSAGFSTGNQVDNGIATSGNTWSVAPGIGYQISKHVTLGIQGKSYNYGFGTTLNAGAFGRYTAYLTPVFFGYVQLNGGYQSSADANNSANDRRGYSVSAVPGIGAFVYKGWAFNLQVGDISYANVSSPDKKHRSRGAAINAGNTLNIGFSKNFGGHKKEAPKE